jgi:hypothetical protein
MLGVQPLEGRWFTAQEDASGDNLVAILSEGLGDDALDLIRT